MNWWVFGAGAIAIAAVVKVAILLRPIRDDGRRRCPHCGHEFQGERRYCIACGGQIWDDVLSEK